MAKCTGGTFNKLSRNYGKVSKAKAKDKKRQAGTEEKTKQSKLRVSGVRTKKHARKKEHRERMAAKDEAERQKALEKEAAAAAEEDVKMSKPKPQKKKKNKNKGGQKSEGPAPMQE
uniref:Uncharacterized protein n=1 Tax=Dunaliella tertiolecta TaxID=3047 RepID=A0A6S8PBH6_DUNTE|mmetsp:Transcript_27837/g.75261  ORF Transcript_27837/g.75261 Transcript_27837/m.75261 type:complete len:116 (+) Transcript_27837:47-394(+)